MIFSIIKKEKYKKQKEFLKENPGYINVTDLKNLNASMPAIISKFHDLYMLLQDVIFHRNNYQYYYYLESKKGYIKELKQENIYCMLTYENIDEKLMILYFNIDQINKIIKYISNKFNSGDYDLNNIKDNKIFYENPIYAIKSHIISILYNIRSVFDLFATIMHALYKKNTNQFINFIDYIKYLEKYKSHDPDMLKYITENFDWFYILRDFRDYYSHFGSIKFSFKININDDIIISINNKIDITKLLNDSIHGLHNFIDFYKNHFSNLLKEELNNYKNK